MIDSEHPWRRRFREWQRRLRDSRWVQADLQGAHLVRADLRGALLLGVNLQSADLREAKLKDAKLWRANLQGARLENANLRDAHLELASLQEADLMGANLRGANLREAGLQEADLMGANLRGAKDLTSEQLAEAHLLAGATMPDGKCYEGGFDLEGDKDLASYDGVNVNDAEALAHWYRKRCKEARKYSWWARNDNNAD